MAVDPTVFDQALLGRLDVLILAIRVQHVVLELCGPMRSKPFFKQRVSTREICTLGPDSFAF